MVPRHYLSRKVKMSRQKCHFITSFTKLICHDNGTTSSSTRKIRCCDKMPCISIAKWRRRDNFATSSQTHKQEASKKAFATITTTLPSSWRPVLANPELLPLVHLSRDHLMPLSWKQCPYTCHESHLSRVMITYRNIPSAKTHGQAHQSTRHLHPHALVNRSPKLPDIEKSPKKGLKARKAPKPLEEGK